MINQQLIKSINKKNIYKLISENPSISRASLANITKLSKATVSVLVEELIKDEYVVDNGTVSTSMQGRRPNSLFVNDKDNYILVINLKSNLMQIALVTVGYDIEGIKDYDLGTNSISANIIADTLNTYIKDEVKSKNIMGICIIVPGIIDEQKQNIVSMVLHIEDSSGFVKALRDSIDIKYPLAIFNDTACLAYADNAFGDIDKQEDMDVSEDIIRDDYSYVFLNINEGVGASLIQNGLILRGATGMGTQFGHFSIDRKGIPCQCGNRGCIENYIGEMALENRVRGTLLEEKIKDIKNIRFKDIAKLASDNDELAIGLIKDLADDLSFGMANLITMLHPDMIIIGGVGKKLGDIYLKFIKESLSKVGFKQFVDDVDIAFSSLEEESIFMGAAKYYMDIHYEFMEDMNGKLLLA